MFVQHPVTALLEDKEFLHIHGSHFPLTASHQFKHWECTLPSLTSWISVTALTYFKLECGLSSPASSQNCEKAILPEVDVPHDPCVTALFVYKFPRFCLCGGTRNKTRDLTKLHIPPQNVCANPRKGTCLGWQHLRVAPAQVSDTSFLPQASFPPTGCQHWLHGVCCTPQASPVFCILHVFVNWVSGGMDSPSPMVTSSTNDMEGTLIFGLSKS